jgi:hypothetical protein
MVRGVDGRDRLGRDRLVESRMRWPVGPWAGRMDRLVVEELAIAKILAPTMQPRRAVADMIGMCRPVQQIPGQQGMVTVRCSYREFRLVPTATSSPSRRGVTAC